MNSKNKISIFLLAFFLHHLNSQYQNYYILAVSFLTKRLKILIYIDIDIYTETAWRFSQALAKNEYTKREKTGEVWFIYKTFICLENITNKSERLSHNLMEKKKEARMSDK